MRIKEEFKKLGYFWLPSAPNRQVPGTLSISDGGHIELEVVHQLGERCTPFGGGGKRVVGLIENDKIVTLDDYSFKGIKGSISISKSLIRVNRTFTGVGYDEDEIPRFNSVTFSVEGIDEWIGRRGINVNHQFEERTTTISYEPPMDVSLNLDNGMQLLIMFRYPDAEKFFEYRVSQKTYFKLISQETRELDDFISVVDKITNFLCFATDQTVSLDSMSTTLNNPHQDIGKDKTGTIPINIYYQSWPYSKDEPKIYWYSMLFGFKQIQNSAEKIINNWIETYEQIAPSFNLYFLAKMGMQTYLEERFMALVQGLEAYHRRTSNERQRVKGKRVRLKDRMRSIIEPFKEVIGDEDKQSKLINRIVSTRNYLTHYDLSLESEAAKGEDLWPLCIKMELLFQLHVLRLIGFSREQIDSLLANSIPLKQKL